MNLDEIVTRAQQYASGTAGSGTTPLAQRDDDMDLRFLKATQPGEPQGYLLIGPGTVDIINFDQAVAWGQYLGLDATKLEHVGQSTYGEMLAAAERFRTAIASKVSIPAPPPPVQAPLSDADAAKVAAEVIRQQKLPGN